MLLVGRDCRAIQVEDAAALGVGFIVISTYRRLTLRDQRKHSTRVSQLSLTRPLIGVRSAAGTTARKQEKETDA